MLSNNKRERRLHWELTFVQHTHSVTHPPNHHSPPLFESLDAAFNYHTGHHHLETGSLKWAPSGLSQLSSRLFALLFTLIDDKIWKGLNRKTLTYHSCACAEKLMSWNQLQVDHLWKQQWLFVLETIANNWGEERKWPPLGLAGLLHQIFWK